MQLIDRPQSIRSTINGRPTNLQRLTELIEIVADECVEWDRGCNMYGYPAVWFGGRTHRATRVACEWAHGAPPSPEMQAAHNCGNRLCVNSRHLRWATPLDNTADQIRHGTAQRGERSWRAKLSADDVRRIRRLHAKGMTPTQIAEGYPVGDTAICNIVHRRTWRWLP